MKTMGMIQEKLEDFKQAEKFFNLSRTWNPKNEEVYNKWILCASKNGNAMEGMKDFVSHIFETSVPSKDLKLGQKQI